jgi:hypothetical protein
VAQALVVIGLRLSGWRRPSWLVACVCPGGPGPSSPVADGPETVLDPEQARRGKPSTARPPRAAATPPASRRYPVIQNAGQPHARLSQGRTGF